LRRAFYACVYCSGCIFKEITLVGSNQGNYFEIATACSKRTLKTTVATQLKLNILFVSLKLLFVLQIKLVGTWSGFVKKCLNTEADNCNLFTWDAIWFFFKMKFKKNYDQTFQLLTCGQVSVIWKYIFWTILGRLKISFPLYNIRNDRSQFLSLLFT